MDLLRIRRKSTIVLVEKESLWNGMKGLIQFTGIIHRSTIVHGKEVPWIVTMLKRK